MKVIKTSDITTGVSYPPSKKGLDFLQASYKEAMSYIVQTFISDTPSTTVGYVLYGCTKTSLGGSNYSYSAGAIYFNGEVYAVDAIASIAITTADICTITTTNDPTADPTTFTDGSVKNVHNVRKIVISNGTSGTGTFDYANAVFINIFKNAFASPTYAGTYGAHATSPIKYSKFAKQVTIKGALKNSVVASLTGDSTVFTLPTGFRPLEDQYFTCADISTPKVAIFVVKTNGDVIMKGGLFSVSNNDTFINCSFFVD